jgi:hypothetical protein
VERTIGRAVTALIFIAVALLGTGRADTGYSGWTSTDGNRQIEYRWNSYGGGPTVPKFDVQLRNLNGDDHKQYNLEVDYLDPQGKDSTYRGYVQWLGYTTIQDVNLYGCTRVSGAMTQGR